MASVTKQLVRRSHADRGITKSRIIEDYCPWVFANIVEEQGFASCPYAMVEETKGNAPNEPAYIVVTGTEVSYAFSKITGKIWVRKRDGTWDLCFTNPACEDGGGHTGAHVFRNRIYFIGCCQLGFFEWQNGNKKVFKRMEVTQQEEHPMAAAAGFLYFGHGQYLGRVDEGYNVSLNQHETRDDHTISAIIPFGDEVSYGTARNGRGTHMYLRSHNSNLIYAIDGDDCGRINQVTGGPDFFRKQLPRIRTYINSSYNQTTHDYLPTFGYDGRLMTIIKQDESDELVLFQRAESARGEKVKLESLASPYTPNLRATWSTYSVSFDTPYYFDSSGELLLASFSDGKGNAWVERLDKSKFTQGFIEFPAIEFNLPIQGMSPRNIQLYYWLTRSRNDFDCFTNVNNTGWNKYDNKDGFGENRDSSTGFHRKDGLSIYEVEGDLICPDECTPTHVQTRITLNPSTGGKLITETRNGKHENSIDEKRLLGIDTPVMRSFIQYTT